LTRQDPTFWSTGRISTEDEETSSGLVFKRKRVDDVKASSHSAFDGHATFFRDNPPSASSPREGHQAPPVADLPAILQQASRCFQNKEVMDSLSEDLLQDRVAQCFGEFLIASSLALSKARDSQTETTKLKEELTLQAKTFSKRETTMYQELASLRQSEKEVKRLLF